MRNASDVTLAERAGHLYRQLILLKRVFDSGDDQPAPPLDDAESSALHGAIREVLVQLAEHARILTTVPFPINDWRPGDGADDERWRALTEVERRELLSLVSAHEELINFVERNSSQPVVRELDASGRGPRPSPRATPEMTEILRAERARVTRFRQDMSFLDRRGLGRESA
jgi:hypothetical protein